MSDRIVPGTRQTRRYWLDLVERVGWTAAQVALAGISVEALDLPGWAVLPVAAGLAALKGLVAKKIGDPGSAAMLSSQ